MTSKESIELWNKLRENLDPKYKLGAPLMLKYTAGEFGSSGTSDSMVWYVSTPVFTYHRPGEGY